MNIIFTCDSLKRGGTERQIVILTTSLLLEGHSVNILTTSVARSEYLQEYPLLEGHIHVVEGHNKQAKITSFRKYYLLFKPEVVVTFDFFSSISALLSYRRYNFVFINGSIRHGVRLKKLSHWLRSLLCWISPWVMANSIAGLKANNLKPGKRCLVFYNGIEDKFKTRLELPLKHNFLQTMFPAYNSGSKVFISVANFNPVKDYFTVLEALSEMKKKLDFFYLIIGEGPMRKQVESRIRELNIEDRVLLLGKRSNVVDYLSVSDYLIHSSKGEGISNAILEAMYSGLPIIATEVGGTPEIVFPASSALFPYKDRQKLLHILENLDQQFSSFDNNSEDYQKHLYQFSVPSMSSRFLSILDSIGIKN